MPRPTCPQDLCLLVVSCDKYADCWEPFSLCLQKFWPDCPYPVYLATETKDAPAHTVYQKALHSKNPSWTGRLREICQQIAEPHILFALEDQWPAKPVDGARIRDVLQLMQRDASVGLIYLDRAPKDFCTWTADPRFYDIPAGSAYRLSAGPAIWRRDFLLACCAEDLNAWDFERIHSFAPASYTHTVLTCGEPLFCRVPPLGAIRRGKWERTVPPFCRENGIPLDLSARGVVSLREAMQVAVKSFFFNLNPALIVKVQNWLYHLRHKEN